MPMLLNPFMSFGSGGIPFSAVVLLCHFDGTNGSTTITDSSSYARALTANGDAKISTSQSVFGGASLILDGTGDWVSALDSPAWSFGSGDFTIEGRIRPNVAAAPQEIICQWDEVANNSWGLYIDALGRLSFAVSLDGTAVTVIADTAALSDLTWYAYAAVRQGGALYLYKNGVMVASTTGLAGSLFASTAPMNVGRQNQAVPGPYYFAGYQDETRITAGYCLYPNGTTYTVATSAFPNS